MTLINNNVGNGDTGLAALLAAGRVRNVICRFPRQTDSWHFDRLYRSGQLELELVPQGNLAERICAADAGIGGFFSPTGFGTDLAQGKESRLIDVRWLVLETPAAPRPPSAPPSAWATTCRACRSCRTTAGRWCRTRAVP